MMKKLKNKYNIETEYKFLVDKIPEEYDEKVAIIQYYFDKNLKKDLIINLFKLNEAEFEELSTARLRVRQTSGGTKYIVTVKSKGGLSRKEYEKEVSSSLYKKFVDNNVFSVIVKNRYYIYREYCFEFDEYLNLRTKMYTCEVELHDQETNEMVVKKIQELLKRHFDINAIDVTNDHRYKNSNLHKYF